VPGAWFIAAVFGVHPVHVESVAWIAERKNTLSLFFYLITAHMWLSWSGLPDGDVESETRAVTSGKQSKRPRPLLYVLMLFFFALALLSKTVTFSLPAAALVVVWWKRGRLRLSDALPLLPLLLMGVCAGAVTSWMEQDFVGANQVQWNLTFVDRMLIAGRAICFYAAKLVWPRDLTFVYPRWQISSADWGQFIFPATVILCLATAWKLKSATGRGPLACLLLFTGTLFPALGFVNVYPMRFSFVADHFQYHASIAFIVLVVVGLVTFARYVRMPVQISRTISAVLLVCLATLTWQQCLIYRDSQTLWQATYELNPNSSLVLTSIGLRLLNEHRDVEAEPYLARAVAADPDFESAQLAKGLWHKSRNEWKEARYHFEQTVRIDKRGVKGHLELAAVLTALGLKERAIHYYQRSVELSPGEVTAWVGLGSLLQEIGEFQLSQTAYQTALRLSPESSVIHYNIGVLHGQAGHSDKAIAAYRRSIELNPDDAYSHINLGSLYAQRRQFREAIEHWESAVRLRPDLSNIRAIIEQARADLNDSE
jgi:protein O-mannosyl-transferase